MMQAAITFCSVRAVGQVVNTTETSRNADNICISSIKYIYGNFDSHQILYTVVFARFNNNIMADVHLS